MEKITPEMCGRYGRKALTTGLQYKTIWFRCKDKRACGRCGNVYVYATGRRDTIVRALASGAAVYTLAESDWGTVKKHADRTGLEGNYIKITVDNVVYFIASTPQHNLATRIEVDEQIIYTVLTKSTGRSQFRGKYKLSSQANTEETTLVSSYFPVFKSNGDYIPTTAVDEQAFVYMYLNPRWERIDDTNVEEFVKWRACVIAECTMALRPTWEVAHFVVDTIEVNTRELRAGEAITNYAVTPMRSGPAIKDETHRHIMELQLGLVLPSVPFESYKIHDYIPELQKDTVARQTTQQIETTEEIKDSGLDWIWS